MYDQTVGLTRASYGDGPIPALPYGAGRQPTIYEYRLAHPHPSGQVQRGGHSYLVGPIAPFPSLVGGGQRYLPGPISAHPEYPGSLSIEGMGSEGYDMGDVAGYSRFRFGRTRVGSYVAPPAVGTTMMF